MKKIAILGLGLLIGINSWAKPIDWTPALESLKHMCSQDSISNSSIDWVSPMHKDEQALKNKHVLGKYLSLSSKKSIVKPFKQVHYLQNATAFNLPITRFELENSGNGMLNSIEIFFKDDKFWDLRSQFYIVKDAGNTIVYANEKKAWLEYYVSDSGLFDGDIYHKPDESTYYAGLRDINFVERKKYADMVINHGDNGEDGLTVYFEANGKGLRYVPEWTGSFPYTSTLMFDLKKKSIRCEYTHPPA